MDFRQKMEGNRNRVGLSTISDTLDVFTYDLPARTAQYR